MLTAAVACRLACRIPAVRPPALRRLDTHRIRSPLPYTPAVPRSSTAVACLDFAAELRAMAAECRRVAEQLEASCPAERRRSLAYHLLAERIPRPEIVATLVSRCGCSTSAAQAAIRDALDRRTKDLSRGG